MALGRLQREPVNGEVALLFTAPEVPMHPAQGKKLFPEFSQLMGWLARKKGMMGISERSEVYLGSRVLPHLNRHTHGMYEHKRKE